MFSPILAKYRVSQIHDLNDFMKVKSVPVNMISRTLSKYMVCQQKLSQPFYQGTGCPNKHDPNHLSRHRMSQKMLTQHYKWYLGGT